MMTFMVGFLVGMATCGVIMLIAIIWEGRDL